MMTWPNKDPDEVDFRTHDWTAELSGSTISGTPTATVVSGDVVIDSVSISGAVQTVWLSGGTDGALCRIELEADFADGRTIQESVSIWVREKR
jgi:hypothetical protein